MSQETDTAIVKVKHNPKLLIGLVLAALLVVAGICAAMLGKFGEPKEREVDTGSDVVTLPVTKVVSRLLSRIDQLPGEIYAYQDVAIYPKVPGFIKWIGIDRGSTVKKGQAMVGLYAPELAAQTREASARTEAVRSQLHEAEQKLYSAKASMLDAKAKMLGDNDTYTRTKSASKVPGVVAPNEVIVLEQTVEADRQKMDAWQQNVLAAEKQIASLKESVKSQQSATASFGQIADYLTVYAPFDGFITERNMHVGSFVGPLGKGAYPPIVRIQQLNLLRVTTPVPEVDTSGVLPGAAVQFSVSTHPGERFTGTVARLGNYLEPKTRTMPVELNYWNHNNRILPGMFCEVYWPTRRQHNTLFVPTSAVENTSTLETFVNRVRADNTIEWVKVKRGLSMGNMIEVFGDVKAGDIVALHATDSLQAGTKVEPKMTAQTEAEASPEPRPTYHTEGTSMVMPESERKELDTPENRGKEWVR